MFEMASVKMSRTRREAVTVLAVTTGVYSETRDKIVSTEQTTRMSGPVPGTGMWSVWGYERDHIDWTSGDQNSHKPLSGSQYHISLMVCLLSRHV